MNIEDVYKEQTGKDATYEEQDEWNAYRTHTRYYHDYINWLEGLANKSLNQTDAG